MGVDRSAGGARCICSVVATRGSFALRDGTAGRSSIRPGAGVVPQSVRLQADDPAAMVDLTATLSQVDTNIDLGQGAFNVDVPTRRRADDARRTAAQRTARPAMTRAAMLPVSIRAHAKINLDLRVLGTRPDGFHELRTVFQAISLHDTIRCIPREGPFAIECDVAGVPLDRIEPDLARGARRSGDRCDAAVACATWWSGSRNGFRSRPVSAAAAPMPPRRWWRWRMRGACR